MDPHDCHNHSHNHDDEEDDLGLSLRPQMDLDAVSCLNEEIPNMGRSVLKCHEERLSGYPFLRSHEDDPELLLHIPFTEGVSVVSLAIRSVPTASSGGDDVPSSPPRIIKLFVNRDDIDFEMARELEPECQLHVVPPDHFVEGTVDYPLRPAGKFRNITSLTLFVQANYDRDEDVATIITYVGLKGKGSGLRRGTVEAVYESRGMLKDHKVKGEFSAQSEI
jgi:hypothetical protein